MSDQSNDPQATDEPLDDLDVPAEQSDAVTGGVWTKPADDEPAGETQGQMNAI